jgi:hypothetical protein
MRYHITTHSDPTMTKCWICDQTCVESDMTVYTNVYESEQACVLYPCCADCVKKGQMKSFGYRDILTHQEAQLLLIKSRL